MYYLPYNKDLKTFSRQLRNNSTHGEILLWKKLRAGSMMGYTFNRQKPLKKYIVDFYCKPLNLVIEIDGGYHGQEIQKIKDSERQQVLEEMGLNFLRFTEKEVRKDINNVLKAIENHHLSANNKLIKPCFLLVFRAFAVVRSLRAFVGLPVRLPLFGLVTSNPSQANKLRIFKSEQQLKQ